MNAVVTGHFVFLAVWNAATSTSQFHLHQSSLDEVQRSSDDYHTWLRSCESRTVV